MPTPSRSYRRVFTQRLFALRRHVNLTHAQLGQLTGLSPRAISQYENGETFPKHASLSRLATALGVNATWLAGREVFLPTPAGISTADEADLLAELLTTTLPPKALERLHQRVSAFLRLPPSEGSS